LITEKNLKSILVDSDSVEKIQPVTSHVGATFAGLFGDFRVLLKYSRKKTLEYKLSYDEPIPMGNISRKMAEVFQEFTQAGGVRPFGISVLLAGIEDSEPRLF
jgi:20S proteasome subunit alpha 2